MKEKKDSNKEIIVERRFTAGNSILFENLLVDWLDEMYNYDKDLSLAETEVAE